MEKGEVDFLTRFVLESDAIEGIRNDPDEVRGHIGRGHPADPSIPFGHAGAILLLRNRQGLVDEPLVKFIQYRIVDGQHLKGERKLRPEEKGEWRRHDVAIRVGDDITRPARRIGARWQNVPRDMDEWVGQVRELQTYCSEHETDLLPTIADVAFLHWRYERIHPFSDGNGRSGRALVYYLYRQLGLPPFVFTARDRFQRYYPCFEWSTPALMERYFLDRLPVV